MKKKAFIMLPCIAAVAIAAFVGTRSLQVNRNYSLLLANVEALSQNDFPDGWRQGFTTLTVWYKEGASVGIEISLTEPGFWAKMNASWKTMRCCMNSVDSNACDFNAEDTKCKNTAVRG